MTVAASDQLEAELQKAFGEIAPLTCLRSMAWHYRLVRSCIRHLASHPERRENDHFQGMSLGEMRRLRRYINRDLHNYGIEFYLQRKQWAEAAEEKHRPEIRKLYDLGVLPMAGGFSDPDGYSYSGFLAQTQACFEAIHAHLVSINRSLSAILYSVTDLPFPTFTQIGRNEILHLSSQLDSLMTALMVGAHLQPRREWQRDLIGFLTSRRADCQRFLETIPRYYQNHRVRLISPHEDTFEHDDELLQLHPTCLPWCAGVYLDFLNAYQAIAQHCLAVLNWSIRLYSYWYHVPSTVRTLISPYHRS